MGPNNLLKSVVAAFRISRGCQKGAAFIIFKLVEYQKFSHMSGGHGGGHGAGHDEGHGKEHGGHEEEHEEGQGEEHGHEEHESHDEGHKAPDSKHEEGQAEPKSEKKEKGQKKKTISEIDIFTLIIIAVLGRVILEPFPSIEPIIPLAVYAGLAHGVDAGILVGLISYPLSNVFMEGGFAGMWTLLQAVGGAVAGGLAGYVNKATKGDLLKFSVIGTVLFEFAVNLPDGALIVWPFSFVHIVSNAFIALLLGELLIKGK